MFCLYIFVEIAADLLPFPLNPSEQPVLLWCPQEPHQSFIYRYVLSIYLHNVVNNPDLDLSCQTLAKLWQGSDPGMKGGPLLLLFCPSTLISYFHIYYVTCGKNCILSLGKHPCFSAQVFTHYWGHFPLYLCSSNYKYGNIYILNTFHSLHNLVVFWRHIQYLEKVVPTVFSLENRQQRNTKQLSSGFELLRTREVWNRLLVR